MTYKYASSITELYYAFKILKSLGDSYPKFDNWFWDKVVPSVLLHNDKVIMAYSRGNLVGISIVKKGIENKLRALRIEPKYQKMGYGLHLIDKSLEELGDDKPLVSVAEDMLHQFSRIFINRYQFDMTYVHKGIYIPDKLEYQFNGIKKSLKEKSIYF